MKRFGRGTVIAAMESFLTRSKVAFLKEIERIRTVSTSSKTFSMTTGLRWAYPFQSGSQLW